MENQKTHSILLAYLFWLLGFMGAHRFYLGKQVSGCIWFFTFGLLGIGWLIDLFLIPGMVRVADIRFKASDQPIDFNLCWILLVFLGPFGIHRIYMQKYISGILWFCTGGLFLLGYLYDFLTLNEQIQESNHRISTSK